ncbi:MAG: sterol desaturase family protein, partial [Saprospiraceae bacterium]|nr:sterol desaturase family protein [Saprospiraceae bacterium]
QHWLAHKVRLIWCLHSPHHAPESMNMLVGFNHSFIEVIFYMPFFLGFMPSLLGVHPVIVLSIAVIDIIWGNLLHINEKVVPSGRYGLLEKILQTPSHHRVHHAQNVMYLDTNYNSMTLFWDWVLGTLQPLREDEKVKYGITRNVKSDNFWDVQFGEFVLLAKDMWNASGILNKLNYLFQPPGWSHTRKHTGLVSELKKELKKD